MLFQRKSTKTLCASTYFFCFLMLLILIHSQTARAGSLSANNNIQVLYIDEQAIGTFHSAGKPFTLSAGEHQVVLRYLKDFGRPTAQNIIASEPIVVVFSITDFQNVFIDGEWPNSIAEARSFVENPQLFLRDQEAKEVAFEQFILPKHNGLQIGRDLLSEISAYRHEKLNRSAQKASAQRNVKAVNEAVAVPISPVHPQTEPDTSLMNSKKEITVPASSEKQLELLKSVYRNADRETQKRFQIWIINQD
jgi:uncharacterized protein YccT (UPF0319 family)